MKGYTVETKTGDVKMVRANILVENVDDMQELENWEARLEQLGQPYLVAYKRVGNKVRYTIFSPLNRKGSAFKS